MGNWRPGQVRRGLEQCPVTLPAAGAMTRLLLVLTIVAPLLATGVRAQSPQAGPSSAEHPTESVRQWLARGAIRLRTVEAGSGFDDMHGLRDVVGDARLVLLGEPTHGNREVYQLKHRMVEFLVEEMGFDVFVLETPMPESFDVDAYVSDGVGDPARALAATQVWPYDTEEIADMLAWMRRHNTGPGATNPLRFYGFDMQWPERAASGALAYLDRVDPVLAAAARQRFGHLAIPFSDPDAAGYRPVVDRDFDASVREAVGAALAAFDANRKRWSAATSAVDWTVARQHVRVLWQWVEANRDGGRRYGAVRDAAMAENIRWILEREGPDAKVVVWAHNAHVANAVADHRSDGSAWAGRHLRRMFGDEMVNVGFLYNRGGFTALDAAADPSRGPRAFTVDSAPEETAEARFAAAGLRLAVVDLRRLPADTPEAEWFRSRRPTRYSWGDFDPSAPADYFAGYVLPEAFDALAYVDATTPTRLLEPADYGALPTLTDPVNLDFEHGLVNQTPTGWVAWSKLRRFGFEIATTDDGPCQGRRAAVIRRAPGDVLGEASGSILQRIDAAPYRGRKVRLRAAVRSELARDGIAFLRLRFQPSEMPDPSSTEPSPFFDSLDEVRVASPEWRFYDIVAQVPEDAERISYGLYLAGAGATWLDAVTVDVVDGKSAQVRTCLHASPGHALLAR